MGKPDERKPDDACACCWSLYKMGVIKEYVKATTPDPRDLKNKRPLCDECFAELFND